jgi:hypothetical protein
LLAIRHFAEIIVALISINTPFVSFFIQCEYKQ